MTIGRENPAPDPSGTTPITSLIADRFAVDLNQTLPDAGGGVPAFAARDMRAGGAAVMALRVQRDRPPRADALDALAGQPIRNVLLPLAHGSLGDNYYVVCQPPPGMPLLAGAEARQRPWAEWDLMENFLRPAALALADLAARGIPHRAIHPANLFRARANAPVVLGAAWAAPPASLQSAVHEPPYIAQCMPAGRGRGAIADDVYALGVTLLALALGRQPMAGLDEVTVIQRKLDLGSFQALIGDDRLPSSIADLARSMLAEDPDHRPPPELLSDPVAARARRVAARPPRRAARPLEVGRIGVTNARGLAWAIGRDPNAGLRSLRDGQAEQWLRSQLGDGTLASQVEQAAAQRAIQDAQDSQADAILIARAVTLLDPLAPLCWRGLVLWPDGLGPALADAASDPARSRLLADLIGSEFISAWAAVRVDRVDEAFLQREARQNRMVLQGAGRRARPGESSDGMIRLRYQLNPLLACASPLLAGHCIVGLRALLPALEAAAGRIDTKAAAPYDREIAAFVAARTTRRDERDEAAMWPDEQQPELAARVPLWLYASLQARLQPQQPLPALAGWLIAHTDALIDHWHNRTRRQTIREAMAAHVQPGQLLPLLALLEDPGGRMADQKAASEAAATVVGIDAALRYIAQGGNARAELARRLGQEFAAGAGLAGLAGILTALAIG